VQLDERRQVVERPVPELGDPVVVEDPDGDRQTGREEESVSVVVFCIIVIIYTIK